MLQLPLCTRWIGLSVRSDIWRWSAGSSSDTCPPACTALAEGKNIYKTAPWKQFPVRWSYKLCYCKYESIKPTKTHDWFYQNYEILVMIIIIVIIMGDIGFSDNKLIQKQVSIVLPVFVQHTAVDTRQHVFISFGYMDIIEWHSDLLRHCVYTTCGQYICTMTVCVGFCFSNWFKWKVNYIPLIHLHKNFSQWHLVAAVTFRSIS